MYEWIGKTAANEKLIRPWARLCGMLPRAAMLLLCRAAALALYGLAGKTVRRRVLDNLSDLLPERSNKELRMTRMRFFENVVIALYEILFESYRLKGSEAWRFQIEGEANLEEALRLGRGAIVYTPHTGNFFYYYWYLCRKYNCLTVATGGSAELRPLYLKFQSMGCPGLDYDDTPPLELVKRLRKHLQAGGIVFLLGDFWRPTFPRSRFFGRLTRTPEGASTLSIEGRVPVVPFYGSREHGFVHRLRFEPALHLASTFTRATRSDATRLLNRFMERVIREHPEHWFYWFNAEERWEAEPQAVQDENGEHHTHTA